MLFVSTTPSFTFTGSVSATTLVKAFVLVPVTPGAKIRLFEADRHFPADRE